MPVMRAAGIRFPLAGHSGTADRQPVGANRVPVGTPVHKGEFAILHVLDCVGIDRRTLAATAGVAPVVPQRRCRPIAATCPFNCGEQLLTRAASISCADAARRIVRVKARRGTDLTAGILRIEDRAAKIARQRRAKRRDRPL